MNSTLLPSLVPGLALVRLYLAHFHLSVRSSPIYDRGVFCLTSTQWPTLKIYAIPAQSPILITVAAARW